MKTVHTAVAVIRRGNEVLVMRPATPGTKTEEPASPAGTPGDGAAVPAGATKAAAPAPEPAPWGFPTAELHRGESAAEACARGVQETLAFEVEQPRAFYTIEYNSAIDLLLSAECFFCEPRVHSAQETDASTAARLVAAAGEPGAALPANAASDGAGSGETGADAMEPDAAESERAPEPAFRWIARSELTSLAWEPVSGQLARVIAASDKEGDEALVKRRADSRKSMQGNKRADTKPEMLVRQRLRAAGLSGYRLQWKKAPGRPDIAYPGRKVAIFVNGCFWHRCPNCQPPVPKRNREFWEAKFARNVERDARAVAELEEQGWHVITIWECELKKDAIDATMERVVAQVRAAK